MGKITCGCLNVKIHTKRNELTPTSPAQLGLSSDCIGDFFSLKLTDVPLDLEGIRVEHACLVRKKSFANWTTHKCQNCDMFTHAIDTNPGTTKILVNCNMLSDPTIHERLEKSADFSKLFKIVIPDEVDNRPSGTVGVESSRYDAVEKTLKSIQQRLDSYIFQEQTTMEERIREFEQRERAAFEALQSKARTDKNAMISMVLSAQQVETDEVGNTFSTQSSHEDMVTSPMSVIDSSPDSSCQDNKVTKSSKSDFSFLKQSNTKVSNKSTVKTPQRPRYFQTKSDHDNEDALFDMEGLHDFDDSRPFYNSDDENDTDDSNSLNDEGVVPGMSAQRSIYSSSVPVSVPSWREYRQRNSSIDEDEEEDERTPAPGPENMAASISALARSVHTDTSDIFGERPRRKVSVLEMGRHK